MVDSHGGSVYVLGTVNIWPEETISIQPQASRGWSSQEAVPTPTLLADKLCWLQACWEGEAGFLLLKEICSKMFVLFQYCFSYGVGLVGWAWKFFPCSWDFPEIKIKTQCAESNQQAFRRIACTLAFYKNPHDTFLTFNHVRSYIRESWRFRSQQRLASQAFSLEQVLFSGLISTSAFLWAHLYWSWGVKRSKFLS